MTIDEFITRLAATKRDWRINPDGAIRCSGHMHSNCPISAVTGNEDHFTYPLEGARALRMHEHQCGLIVEASDTRHMNPELRKRLLLACNLPAEEPSP